MLLSPARLTTWPTWSFRCPRLAGAVSLAIGFAQLSCPQNRFDASDVSPQGTHPAQPFGLPRGRLEAQRPEIFFHIAQIGVQAGVRHFLELRPLHDSLAVPRLTNLVLMGSL